MGSAALESWQLVRTMLDDMTTMVREDAETELELLEGLRVLARATALCSELSVDVDVDVDAPWFFPMNTEARFIGGPNPDGEYALAMIDGSHRYRVRGTRGTTAYLGFQVLAGVGLTPRRNAAYLSDRDLRLGADGRFSFVISATEPAADELGDGHWLEVPTDASAIVVREYIADRTTEVAATGRDDQRWGKCSHVLSRSVSHDGSMRTFRHCGCDSDPELGAPVARRG